MDSKKSNLVNCVDAVNECDVFLGFIRPLVGSGVLEKGGRSITAQEFDEAYRLPMPHFVLADYRVEFAHKFLNLMRQDLSKIPPFFVDTQKREDGSVIEVRKPNLVVHAECVEIYRLAIQNGIRPVSKRVGNWAQPYFDETGIMRFIEGQFKNVERIRSLI